ncbi:hypothetical protein B0H14DRAFT_2258483, partial [Mycena olivaceomarginata]
HGIQDHQDSDEEESLACFTLFSPPPSTDSETSCSNSLRSISPSVFSVTSSMFEQAFRVEFGREFNTLSVVYGFPVDGYELERLVLRHLIRKSLCLPEILQDDPNEERKAALDLGCGSGARIMELARAYLYISVVGVDLVPIQASTIPGNCRFEVDDINLGLHHFYGDFNIVHMWRISSGIKNCVVLIDQISRILRGGVLLDVIDFCLYDHRSDGNHKRLE